jgi:hypothetical protein
MMKTVLIAAALALTVTAASAQVSDPVAEIDRQMAYNRSISPHLDAEGLPLAATTEVATFAFGYWRQVDGGIVPVEVVMFEGKPVVVLPVVTVEPSADAWLLGTAPVLYVSGMDLEFDLASK